MRFDFQSNGIMCQVFWSFDCEQDTPIRLPEEEPIFNKTLLELPYDKESLWKFTVQREKDAMERIVAELNKLLFYWEKVLPVLTFQKLEIFWSACYRNCPFRTTLYRIKRKQVFCLEGSILLKDKKLSMKLCGCFPSIFLVVTSTKSDW